MTPTEFAVKTLYWFFLYGFIGWGVEVVYAAVKTHKLVNRGFLCGPICPIYGFGMVGLIYSVSLIPMPDSGSMSAVAIFFIGMILTTAIELVGGWALFKIYHIRWWDYSNMKFNLGGYICPQFSLLWGLGSVLMIKVIHPLLARGSSPMPFNIMLIVDVVLLVLFVVDVAASTAAAIGLNKYLREIDELRAKLRVTSDKLTTVLGTGAMTVDTILDEQKLQLALAKLEGRENADVLRAELELNAQRRVAVLEPVKLIIDNYPADQCEYFDLPNNPNRDANDTTTRKVAFTKELWIENSDFFEVPPPKFKRLTLGSEVRLMGAYLVRCTGVDKDENGKVVAIHAEADLETRNGNPADGRKVRGTIHWVSCAHCLDAEVELYDKLFTEANMNSIPDDADFKDYLNPDSVKVLQGAKLEESLKDAKPGDRFQFVRNGYFTPDSKHEGVYNRIVTLKDSFKL